MNFNTKDFSQEEIIKSLKSIDEPGKSPVELKVSCSGVLMDPKTEKKVIYVRFERGDEFAEGKIPEGKIVYRKGFLDEEIKQFEKYLIDEKFSIIEEAKKINVLKAL